MSSFDPIIPEPDWGITSPNVDPDEWIEEEESEEDDEEWEANFGFYID